MQYTIGICLRWAAVLKSELNLTTPHCLYWCCSYYWLMNFLAHYFFSFDDDDLLLGQFIADEIKGNKYLTYPPRIQCGILLHRAIDSFTDEHPLCRQLRSQIRSQLGLLSPVAIDIFFDHILAAHWTNYHRTPLEIFAQDIYSKLEKRPHQLSPRSKILLQNMKQNNWLVGYKTIEGTSTLLQQMSSRLPYGQALAKAPQVLLQHHEMVEKTFHNFFPELNVWTNAKLDTFAHQLAEKR